MSKGDKNVFLWVYTTVLGIRGLNININLARFSSLWVYSCQVQNCMEDIVGVGIGPFLWYSTPHPWEGFSSAVYHFSVCILSVILVLEVDMEAS